VRQNISVMVDNHLLYPVAAVNYILEQQLDSVLEQQIYSVLRLLWTTIKECSGQQLYSVLRLILDNN